MRPGLVQDHLQCSNVRTPETGQEVPFVVLQPEMKPT